MPTVVFDQQIFAQQRVGGISRYFYELAARIGQHGEWRAQIVAPLYCNEYLARGGAPTVGLYAPSFFRRAGRTARAASALSAAAMIAAYRPNVIHTTYYRRPTPKGSRVPVVVTVHDMIHELYPHYFPAGDPWIARKRRSIDAADHIVCVSQRTADDLMRLAGVPASRITVVHLGYSDAFQGRDAAPARAVDTARRPYLLYVGDRTLQKNFFRFLEAYDSSPRLAKDVDVMVFGGGALTPRERERIASLQLRADAIRSAAGDDVQLAQCYRQALAFVYPSEYEGFGIPPLESMASDCPVVCSDRSSIPEIVGAAGEYFDPHSVESIRSALECVVYDEARRAALIAAGRERRALFSWDRCAKQTLAVYRRLG